jgi:uncharacterized SAM-dependent methyltransferase
VDLDRAELERTLSTLVSTISQSVSFLTPSLEAACIQQQQAQANFKNNNEKKTSCNKVHVAGIHASYDSALPFISSLSSSTASKSLLWLGSSIGNFTRSEAADFLLRYGEAALSMTSSNLTSSSSSSKKSGETMLIGIDCCDDGDKISRAYDDSRGVTRKFVLNGVKSFVRALGIEDEDVAEEVENAFEYVSRWNGPEGRHEVRVCVACVYARTDRG